MTASGASFSPARLARMHDVMKGYIERGEVPGLVTALYRRGELHVDAIGNMAVGAAEPMRRDTLFRITSMTKPVTAAAAMILVEECKMRLDDPVDRWLPELANRRVLKSVSGPIDDTVPAIRRITVRDLLTFRFGFGMLWGDTADYPIRKEAEARGILIGPPKPATPHDPDAWIGHFGALPLMYQPGERWLYNTGSHVLGVLVARVSGKSLPTFFAERIFEPLGMKDTSFSVPPDKLSRLATSYWPDPTTGALVLHDEPAGQWASPPAFPDGAAGLVSTADDYLAFGRMLLAKGKLGTAHILSRPSVELMTTDHLTPEQKLASSWFPGHWDALGWGFGVSIVTRRDNVASTPGRYGWDGGYGTTWSSDPAEDMVSILLTQRAGFPLFSGVQLDFWTSAYQAIDD